MRRRIKTARTINFPGGLVVDMGVTNPTTSFALGLLTDEGLLELELSALESDGLKRSGFATEAK